MRLAIIGGKTDGISCLEIAESIPGIEVVGFLNDVEGVGNSIEGYPVLEMIDNWRCIDSDIHFIYSLHRLKDMWQRYQRLMRLEIPRERFATLVHPQAFVSRFATLGAGTVVWQFATVQNNATIGDLCSIRAGASIGHDCQVGEFTYIGPKATLSGFAKTATGVYVAPNAAIGIDVSLEKFATVGMCAAVNKDVREYELAQGNPARIIGNYKDAYTA